MKSVGYRYRFDLPPARVLARLLILAIMPALAAKAFAQGTPQATGPGFIEFVQLSDTHWGFNNPKINPDFQGTLAKGLASVNALPDPLDFIIFTGDETHGTSNDAVRRQRMGEFKAFAAKLKASTVYYLPGEHDSSFDAAKDYTEFFGPTHYSFTLKGVTFIGLDNVTFGDGTLGDDQLAWLAGVLDRIPDKKAPLVLFAHRPFIDVYPKWGWKTDDGAKALDLLKPFSDVTLFYGHIHQLRKDGSGSFTQYAAQGMMFPLPAPGSTEKPDPVAWDPAAPYRGLGFRTVRLDLATGTLAVQDYAVDGSKEAAR